MLDDRDAEVLEILRRQVWQDRLVYLVLAECRLVSEAQAPQPTTSIIVPQLRGCCTSSCGLGRVSRRLRDKEVFGVDAVTSRAQPRPSTPQGLVLAMWFEMQMAQSSR